MRCVYQFIESFAMQLSYQQTLKIEIGQKLNDSVPWQSQYRATYLSQILTLVHYAFYLLNMQECLEVLKVLVHLR